MNGSQIFTAVSVIGTIAWINSRTSTPTSTIHPISHSTTTTTTSTSAQRIGPQFRPASSYDDEEDYIDNSYDNEEEDDDENCHPSYSPCIPYAYDVDCASGKGNGPVYVYGPVRVIGPDVYDLDRDGDGIGCEK